MVWESGEEAWETKLATRRSYRKAVGHLVPWQDAVWDKAVGGWLSGSSLPTSDGKTASKRTPNGARNARNS